MFIEPYAITSNRWPSPVYNKLIEFNAFIHSFIHSLVQTKLLILPARLNSFNPPTSVTTVYIWGRLSQNGAGSSHQVTWMSPVDTYRL